jgi:hypothetical protein
MPDAEPGQYDTVKSTAHDGIQDLAIIAQERLEQRNVWHDEGLG